MIGGRSDLRVGGRMGVGCCVVVVVVKAELEGVAAVVEGALEVVVT